MGCRNYFNCWQNNGRTILAHSRKGNNSPTHLPFVSFEDTKFGCKQQSKSSQVPFWTWEASVCNQTGCKSGCHLRLTATCHIVCSVGTPLPLTRETISICLPCLICLGLSWQRLHQNDAGNLKAPSLHLSLSFALSSFFFSPALPLFVLFRQKLGVANAFSLAHQKRKQKKKNWLICCCTTATRVGVNTTKEFNIL